MQQRQENKQTIQLGEGSNLQFSSSRRDRVEQILGVRKMIRFLVPLLIIFLPFTPQGIQLPCLREGLIGAFIREQRQRREQ